MPQPFPFYETNGGFRVASFSSGLTAGTNILAGIPGGIYGPLGGGSQDIVVFSGAGRLNTIIPGYTSGLAGNSGLGCTIYDSAPALCGASGPCIASGQRLIAVVPANVFNLPGGGGPAPIQVNVPFYSGLCVGRLTSGVAGFSIVYTPEYNPLFAG